MSELAWFWPVLGLVVTILTLGATILIATVASNRSLRQELGGRIDAVQSELGGRIDAVQRELGGRIDAVQSELGGRIDVVQRELGGRIDRLGERIAAVQLEMSERFGGTNDRFARVEGLVEGIGFALRKRQDKNRSDGEDAPTPPPS